MMAEVATSDVFNAIKADDTDLVMKYITQKLKSLNPGELAKHLSKAETSGKQSTMLHWACYAGATECAKILLHFGADVEAVESDNKTPLHWATFEGHHELVVLLLRAGAHPEVENALKLTPCHLALLNNHYDVARLFSNYRIAATGYKFIPDKDPDPSRDTFISISPAAHNTRQSPGSLFRGSRSPSKQSNGPTCLLQSSSRAGGGKASHPLQYPQSNGRDASTNKDREEEWSSPVLARPVTAPSLSSRDDGNPSDLDAKKLRKAERKEQLLENLREMMQSQNSQTESLLKDVLFNLKVQQQERATSSRSSSHLKGYVQWVAQPQLEDEGIPRALVPMPRTIVSTPSTRFVPNVLPYVPRSTSRSVSRRSVSVEKQCHVGSLPWKPPSAVRVDQFGVQSTESRRKINPTISLRKTEVRRY